MITEINNKIVEVIDTVASCSYQTVKDNVETDYCVFYYFGNDSTGGDTKDGIEDLFIQFDYHAKSDLEVETKIQEIEDKIKNSSFSTTNYKLISKQKLQRVPFPPDTETGIIKLGTQYNFIYERV